MASYSKELKEKIIEKGYAVKYYRMLELLLEIQESKSENKYSRFMTRLQNIKLLNLTI